MRYCSLPELRPVDFNRLSALVLALCLSDLNALTLSLFELFTLQLRESCEYGQHEFARRRVGVDLLLVTLDTLSDLLALIEVAQRFGSCKLRPRIAFFLLGKHKFQVYLVVGIVVNQYAEIGALRKEILKVLTDLDNLVNGSFKLFFPRKILLIKLPLPMALSL